MYFSTDNNNDAQWKNPEYDALLRRAETETDRTFRLNILRDAEAILMREQPIAPIHFYKQIELFDSERVEGVHPNAWHYRRLEWIAVKSE